MKFFSRLNVGSKVAFIVTLLVVVCICVLTFCIIATSKHILQEENHRILHQASYRYGTLLDGVATRIQDTLFVGATAIDTQIAQNNISYDSFKNIVSAIPNNIASINYAYLYIPQLNNQGEVLILAEESGVRGENAKIVQFEEAIKHFKSIQESILHNKPSLSNPTTITFQNKQLFAQGFAVPIHDKNGKAIGALGCFVDYADIGAPLLDESARVFANDQRFVIDGNGVIIINQNPQYIGKKLDEVVRTQESKDIVTAAGSGENGIYPYLTAAGIEGIIGMHTITPLQGSEKYWSILSYIPNDSITRSLEKLLRIIIVCSLSAIVVIALGTIYYLRTSVGKRIRLISHTLFEFFNYLNHKRQTPPEPLRIIAQDELGQMGLAINENIQQTKIGLEQDAKAVEQSV
ncbi:chemotaxis protein, partial [Helicobacter marmotae]